MTARVRYVCCGHRSQPPVNLLNSTYIFHFTHSDFCAAAQPEMYSQLILDYLEHELHGLLELYLLHRIGSQSIKSEYLTSRQQLFSWVMRTLETILNTISTDYAPQINQIQKIVVDNFNSNDTVLSFSEVDIVFILGTAELVYILGFLNEKNFLPANRTIGFNRFSLLLALILTQHKNFFTLKYFTCTFEIQYQVTFLLSGMQKLKNIDNITKENFPALCWDVTGHFQLSQISFPLMCLMYQNISVQENN